MLSQLSFCVSGLMPKTRSSSGTSTRRRKSKRVLSTVKTRDEKCFEYMLTGSLLIICHIWQFSFIGLEKVGIVLYSSVSDPDSLSPDPDLAFWGEYRSASNPDPGF
jgi:hypothetical protein